MERESQILTSPHASRPLDNRLLAALPPHEYGRLAANLEPISMAAGEVIAESGVEQDCVFFPATLVVSLLYGTETGASAGIALIGFEGMVGVQLLMGATTTASRSIVLCAGEAYRLRADLLYEEMALGGSFRALSLRYIQALITQMGQTAACNRHHQIDQQLCRWLLLNLDRTSSNTLMMTQELIASMLGVRREGVMDAASKLQDKGAIHYSRGHITVIDRAALEAVACECYAVVKNEYTRLLSAN